MDKHYKTVSVLIAVFEPNLVWFGQLLRSIQRQSFQDYEVLIMDDGSVQVEYADIVKTVDQVFGKQKRVSVMRSDRNEGSDKTFEKLVLLAHGEFVAFCDQDDIWETQKLWRLVAKIRRSGAVLAYSDMSVMNQNGRLVYPSLRSLRVCLNYVSGSHLTAMYVMENCTASCSMLVRREYVQRAMPFYEGVYCDQWICALAAAFGTVAFVDLPLVRYRRHSDNQTGTLRQIQSRQDYYDKRVLPAYGLVLEMKKRGIHYKYETDIQAFVRARKNMDIPRIWKYRKYNKKYAYFDIFMFCMPKSLVRWLFKILQSKGRASG